MVPASVLLVARSSGDRVKFPSSENETKVSSLPFPELLLDSDITKDSGYQIITETSSLSAPKLE
jgi:hypothetical protein